MIYNDQFVSDHKSASRRSDGERQDREEQRLDVMNSAGQSFLLFAASHVLYRVELDNLRLTEENLELATVREKVGYSGKDEVFRWEAEVATRKSQLLAREAEIETNRIKLNQILNIDQQTRWSPVGIDVDPDFWPFLDGRLNPYGATIAGTARLLDVMVELAVESSPGIRSKAMNIDAQEITLAERKRRWYLPVFGIDASYDIALYQSPQGQRPVSDLSGRRAQTGDSDRECREDSPATGTGSADQSRRESHPNVLAADGRLVRHDPLQPDGRGQRGEEPDRGAGQVRPGPGQRHRPARGPEPDLQGQTIGGRRELRLLAGPGELPTIDFVVRVRKDR
jgi:hypothetical protein